MWIVIVVFAAIAGFGLHDMSMQQAKLEKQNMVLQAKVKKLDTNTLFKVTMLDGVEITNLEAKD